jgi:hypothetical protein
MRHRKPRESSRERLRRPIAKKMPISGGGSAWTAPEGFVLSKAKPVDDLDIETVSKDPALELWLIKIPQGVRSAFQCLAEG